MNNKSLDEVLSLQDIIQILQDLIRRLDRQIMAAKATTLSPDSIADSRLF